MGNNNPNATHNATEILREIVKEMPKGKIFTSRELYGQYLEYIGKKDTPVDYGAAKRMCNQYLKDGLLDPIYSPNSKKKAKRAVKYKKIGAQEIASHDDKDITATPVEVEDKDKIEDVNVVEAEAKPSDIVTDSQIGKSIIYYIDELKKRIHTIAQEMQEDREKHRKLAKDLRDSLKNTEKELHDEREKANNLRIALNRMRNVPETNNKPSTFKMNEIADIKEASSRKKVFSL